MPVGEKLIFAAALNGAADAELAHAGLEGGALDVEEDGGAFGTGDPPLCLLKRAEDELTFGFFEGGDWRRPGGRGR